MVLFKHDFLGRIQNFYKQKNKIKNQILIKNKEAKWTLLNQFPNIIYHVESIMWKQYAINCSNV